MSRRDWLTAAIALSLGVLVFQVGFRLTSEVLPVVALLIAGSFVFGFAAPRHPWLWALAIGIGARLFPEPALSQEHLQREGASRPLPLPFGLTDSAFAQWAAGSLIIMAFPFVGTVAGWSLAKLIRK